MSKFEQPPRGLSIREMHRQGQIQARTARSKIITKSFSFTIPASSRDEYELTVEGVASNDQVAINYPPFDSFLYPISHYVSGKDKVTVQIANTSGGDLSFPTGDVEFRVFR